MSDQQAIHNNIRVMVVDDHLRVHQAIAAILSFTEDIELVAQAHNGEQALALCAQHAIDIILMDVLMPKMDGVETTRRVLAHYPHIKILALSSFNDDQVIRDMLMSGAVGYVLKDESADDLVHILRTVHQGQHVVSPDAMKRLLDVPTPPKPDFKLSAREQDVLRLMVEGKTYDESADALGISTSTVRFHVVNILSKLGVSTRAEAIVIAIRHDLV